MRSILNEEEEIPYPCVFSGDPEYSESKTTLVARPFFSLLLSPNSSCPRSPWLAVSEALSSSSDRPLLSWVLLLVSLEYYVLYVERCMASMGPGLVWLGVTRDRFGFASIHFFPLANIVFRDWSVCEYQWLGSHVSNVSVQEVRMQARGKINATVVSIMVILQWMLSSTVRLCDQLSVRG